MVTTAVILSFTVAFAADTSTKISIDYRSQFSVNLQSNSLMFSNEPTDKAYDGISLDILTKSGAVVRNVTYNRG